MLTWLTRLATDRRRYTGVSEQVGHIPRYAARLRQLPQNSRAKRGLRVLLMFKIIQYVYEKGRKQAYTEIVGELEVLADKLPHTRDGQRLKEPIRETVDKLLKKLDEGAE